MPGASTQLPLKSVEPEINGALWRAWYGARGDSGQHGMRTGGVPSMGMPNEEQLQACSKAGAVQTARVDSDVRPLDGRR
jgi:hypothetical protein